MRKVPKIYYRARLDTRHFEFEAFDVTADAARRAMFRAVKRHSNQYNVPAGPMIREYCNDVIIDEIRIGFAYRDHSPV